jgi:oxygen-independent coproporphyrinogen-3 oxidase
VSNHARGASARSRHNLVYWRGGDYIGVGPGAHGRITDAGGARWATLAAAKIPDYLARVGRTGSGLATREPLSPREAALERLLMGLRTDEGVATSDLAALDIDPAVIDGFVADGLLARPSGGLAATVRGRPVLDRIILELAQAARTD